MIDKLQKSLVDVVYAVARGKSKYERDNPDEKVLAADGSKAIMTRGDQDIERGLAWAGSKRAVVMLTNKRLKGDQWDIPLENIQTARLLKIGSLFGQGQVLKLKTKDNEHYQFGMQFNPAWVAQKVLPLTLEQGQVKTSALSWVVRLIAIGYLVYWALNKFEVI